MKNTIRNIARLLSIFVSLTFLALSPSLAQAEDDTFVVSSPILNVTWQLGSTYTISWISPEFFAPNNVAIYLGPEEPACYSATPPCSLPEVLPFLITSRAPNTGSYQWTVPTNLSSAFQGRQQIAIVIENTTFLGVSSPFTIAASSTPNPNPTPTPTPTPTPIPTTTPTPTPTPTCRDGQNVKYASSPTIYYIQNCKKLPYTTSSIFYAWNSSFNNVVTISETESYATSWFVRLPNDFLVKASNSQAVYKVENSDLRPFVSAESFLSYGYTFSQVKVFSQSDIDLHYFGSPIYPR